MCNFCRSHKFGFFVDDKAHTVAGCQLIFPPQTQHFSVIFSDDSQVTYVFIVLAIILFIVMVAMISVICIKSGKKKLPPADVIPEVCAQTFLCCCRVIIRLNWVSVKLKAAFSPSTASHYGEGLQRQR